jgi:hypothetical protein
MEWRGGQDHETLPLQPSPAQRPLDRSRPREHVAAGNRGPPSSLIVDPKRQPNAVRAKSTAAGRRRQTREDPPSPRLLVVGLLRAGCGRSRGASHRGGLCLRFRICGHLRDLWFQLRSPFSALCFLLSPARCSAFFSLLVGVVVGVVIDRLGQPRFVPASHGAECHRKLPRFRFQPQKRNLTYKSQLKPVVNHCL